MKKQNKMKFAVLAIVLTALTLAVGTQKPTAPQKRDLPAVQPQVAAPRPTAPPPLAQRRALLSYYLQPDPAFLEQHKDESVQDVYAANTMDVFVKVFREQAERIRELESRVAALEKAHAPAEPNKPADPNNGGKTK
jgi:hypothetical protein